MYRLLKVLILSLVATANVYSAENPIVPEIDSLKNLFTEIQNAKSDSLKIEINNYLKNYLELYLKKQGSFTTDFKEVKNLGVLKSDDNKLRVYTWNLNFSDGSFKYYGFLQYKDNTGVKVYFLDDKKYGSEGEIRLFQTYTEWYGALYYEIITKKWNSTTYYTLLGWDGADFLINRKVVEALYFDRKAYPIFGKKIFKLNRVNAGRLIFEFSDRATMLLRYNSKQDMIVMDHLVPSEPKFANMYQYYGPDFSFDALVFRGGKWILQSDIDPNVAINYKRDSRINSIKRRGTSKDF
jgi:hypothetical protein